MKKRVFLVCRCSIFKASSKKEKLVIFQKPNFLFGQTLQYETYYDPRFFSKIGKTNMFFKAICEEQQKNRNFRQNHKLLEPQSSNVMKSRDFVADRSCFCLLRSCVYVQRLQSGVNRVQKPHFTVFPSNFITAHKAKVQQCYKKLFKTSLKDTLGKIFRVFKICALTC